MYASFRPHLIEFLEAVNQIFEVVLFTASEVRNDLINLLERICGQSD